MLLLLWPNTHISEKGQRDKWEKFAAADKL